MWQSAQNFSAKTGEILPWTDLEGLLIRNGPLPSDYTKSENQIKQQRIATRIHGLATPEISNQLDSVFKENDIFLNGLESFAELILYSTSNDICEKFGIFEDPDFYNTNNGKTQTQLKTMKDLAQNASRRKQSLREFMQVANTPQPANFVTMTTTNQTTPKKYKRSRTSFSGSKRGNTKASRKAAKAAAEPKTPSPSANTSKKRPRWSVKFARQTVTVVGEEEDGPSSYPHGLSPCSRCHSKGW